MMKVLAITFGDPSTGSTLYRVMQYKSFLAEQGITLDTLSKNQLDSALFKNLSSYDCVINQKCLLPLRKAHAIKSRAKRLIFDFDDAVYTRPGNPFSWIAGLRVRSRLKFWLKHAETVTAANHHLGQYALSKGAHVQVLPMTLDLSVWKPAPQESQNTLTIGWAGAPANLHHLERLQPVLKPLLSRYKHLKIAVYSGKKPRLDFPFEYVPFENGTEHLFTQKLDIGLLPLTNDEFSKGKSPIKAIQYLACGVPVVGNVEGATTEILNGHNSIPVSSNHEWLEAIDYLVRNPKERAALGSAGRQHVLEHNNFEHGKKQWVDLLMRKHES